MSEMSKADLQIDIDWHSLKPFKAPGRLFASRADAAIREAFPDFTAIWRARASSSLDWKDGVWVVASNLAGDMLGALIDAIDGLRLGGWIPRTYYLLERNATMKLAVVARRSVRLGDKLTGPDLAEEYTDGKNTYAKLYRVR